MLVDTYAEVFYYDTKGECKKDIFSIPTEVKLVSYENFFIDTKDHDPLQFLYVLEDKEGKIFPTYYLKLDISPLPFDTKQQLKLIQVLKNS